MNFIFLYISVHCLIFLPSPCIYTFFFLLISLFYLLTTTLYIITNKYNESFFFIYICSKKHLLCIKSSLSQRTEIKRLQDVRVHAINQANCLVDGVRPSIYLPGIFSGGLSCLQIRVSPHMLDSMQIA